jgi:hypothetical protein
MSAGNPPRARCADTGRRVRRRSDPRVGHHRRQYRQRLAGWRCHTTAMAVSALQKFAARIKVWSRRNGIVSVTLFRRSAVVGRARGPSGRTRPSHAVRTDVPQETRAHRSPHYRVRANRGAIWAIFMVGVGSCRCSSLGCLDHRDGASGDRSEGPAQSHPEGTGWRSACTEEKRYRAAWPCRSDPAHLTVEEHATSGRSRSCSPTPARQ